MSDTKKTNKPAKRKWLPLDEKLDIIRCHEAGASYAKIARQKGMNEASVRTIIKMKHQYKEQAMVTSSNLSKVTCRRRSSVLNNMERLLLIWIEDCNKKGIAVNQISIQNKAVNLFNTLKKNEEETDTNELFSASRGWFFRFKNRAGLHNVRITGENTYIDKETLDKYPNEAQKIINEGGFMEEQIFYIDETELFWKKMPQRTFTTENENLQTGYVPSKDRLSLLLGGNASGDFKIKPLLVFRAESPRGVKDFTKDTLPVIWRSNKKAWITKELFSDWFSNYFCPNVESYCSNHGIDFNILLIMDSVPSRPAELFTFHEHIKVHFLSPNTNLMHGVFNIFKGLYLKRTFSQASASAAEVGLSLQKFWKNYTIKNAIENIGASWNEITNNNMRSIWYNILPNTYNNYTDSDSQLQAVAEDIVKIGKDLGFETLDIADIRDCINAHSNDLDDVSLLEMDQQRSFQNEEKIDITEIIIAPNEFPQQEHIFIKEEDQVDPLEENSQTQQLEKVFLGIQMACDAIKKVDSNTERGSAIRHILQNSIQCYRDIYTQTRNKQMYNCI